MPQKQATMEELVSHMLIMGRLMRDKMHKSIGTEQCTMLEFATLKYVKDAGKPHMRDVARNFHVTPPAATLLIDSLVKGKLLVRVVDLSDRRSVRVNITAKGKKLLDQGVMKKMNELKKTFSILTPTERAQFIAILKKIIKNNS